MGAKNGWGNWTCASMSELPAVFAGKRPVVKFTGFTGSLLKPLTIAIKDGTGLVSAQGCGDEPGIKHQTTNTNGQVPIMRAQRSTGRFQNPRPSPAMDAAELRQTGIGNERRLDAGHGRKAKDRPVMVVLVVVVVVVGKGCQRLRQRADCQARNGNQPGALQKAAPRSQKTGKFAREFIRVLLIRHAPSIRLNRIVSITRQMDNAG
jgi:hypothetical protein